MSRFPSEPLTQAEPLLQTLLPCTPGHTRWKGNEGHPPACSPLGRHWLLSCIFRGARDVPLHSLVHGFLTQWGRGAVRLSASALAALAAITPPLPAFQPRGTGESLNAAKLLFPHL